MLALALTPPVPYKPGTMPVPCRHGASVSSREVHHARIIIAAPFPSCLHPDRTADGHRDHRYSGRHFVPVFAKAREKARQTSCTSNLKQMGIEIGRASCR